MNSIKYLGETSTQELINLIKADIDLKQNLMQFAAMPNYADYVGKIVQYVGNTNEKFTMGHFYKSNGFSWYEVYSALTIKAWELVDALPALEDAEWNIMYFLANKKFHTLKGFVRGEEQYYEVGTTKSWEIVDTVPAWEDANPDVIYFVLKDRQLVGHIKNEAETGKFYVIGDNVMQKVTLLNEDGELGDSEYVNANDIEFEEIPASKIESAIGEVWDV